MEKHQRMNVTGRGPTDYKSKWQKEKADTMTIQIKKAVNLRGRIEAAAIMAGISKNQYMIQAIEKQLTADGYPAPTEGGE